MSQKVWVLEDISENQVSACKVSQRDISASKQKSTKQKNASLAYGLSFIIWGCGQFYNRQWKLGLLFLLSMINFCLCMCIGIIYRKAFISVFESNYVDRGEALLIFIFFYLAGLAVWHFNAWQAYFKRKKMDGGSHKSRKITLLPAVCSLLMPGWGQLLNGQTKKGLFFQVFAFTGLAALPFIIVTYLLWPTLQASQSLLIIEWIFSISVILVPFILIMWIVNIYDAAKVGLNNRKKEPLTTRIKYWINRFNYHIQIYGWKNAVLPAIKRTILIILLLIFCGISWHYVPQKFYMQQLQNIGNDMSDKEFTIIPSFINKLPTS